MAVSERRSALHVLAALCLNLSCSAQALELSQVEHALQFSRRQLAATASRLPANMSPKSTRPDGSWVLIPATDERNWTQGFFPGELWLAYESTADTVWSTRAAAWTRSLEPQKCNMQTHDLGFKLYTGFGNGLRLAGSAGDKAVLLTAAGALASRYHPKVGVLSTGDWNPAWHLPTVVDSMMNLELLFWGAANGGQRGWFDMALNHALRTAADMVRADGGTFHVVDYDPLSGALLSRGTYQGYSDSSTWSRGQAWALYGFTVAYRYSRDVRMLDAARKVADYYVRRLPPDGVPNWDFDAPRQHKDSSAAAAAASGLLELADFMSDPAARRRYLDAATRSLEALAGPGYLAEGTASQGILLHGVGNLPTNQEIDVSLVYGDYYFMEALLRYKALLARTWYSKHSASEYAHLLGTGHTGIQVAEFDLTPLERPIDSAVGYAGSATSGASLSNMAMLIRMSPKGHFEVRNGAAYQTLAALPYQAHTAYHVRMVTDLSARRYSVWITPCGGAETLVADNYLFRSDAPRTEDLGKVLLRSGHHDGEYKLENHTLRRAESLEAARLADGAALSAWALRCPRPGR